MEKLRTNNLIPLLATIAALGLAYGLDTWVTHLESSARQNFQFAALVYASLLAELVIAAMLLGLAWVWLLRPPPRPWVAALALALGLVVLSLPLRLLFDWSWLSTVRHLPLFDRLALDFSLQGFSARLLDVAALLTLLGLAGLWRGRHG